ncbi:GIY-YIG catalytic domain-containing protein [Eilatimonas milleporae]|uniref:GIY-YIG catalytic domain-containing protein n=2 Tax=Eilatimonas milleporae TaxID=911205 RepID=A0A3M0CP69_9PROT|nr:GIY-YIG catalytic domain-containing protein [Eilatimonas milleporae]
MGVGRLKIPCGSVYFLELKNGDIYVGSTSDLKQRKHTHDTGRVPSTKAFLPAELKAYVSVGMAETPLSLERYFKSGSGLTGVSPALQSAGIPAGSRISLRYKVSTWQAQAPVLECQRVRHVLSGNQISVSPDIVCGSYPGP